ncbi:uncharacterized protein A4U43_C05F3780 [Asparagus officinalis]|uniref:Uncharacterized protein n=1 Tax=Asparagus officinalis TaxID=4686 RepID=A0A5P1EP43_ASPOF|nr:uncharacterized protein A4U43_C05F3780 [Asparagus officinalis]
MTMEKSADVLNEGEEKTTLGAELWNLTRCDSSEETLKNDVEQFEVKTDDVPLGGEKSSKDDVRLKAQSSGTSSGGFSSSDSQWTVKGDHRIALAGSPATKLWEQS